MSELTYLAADGTDVSAICSLSKALVDRYEDVSHIHYDAVITWVRNKIRENIADYTCVFRGSEKVGYYHLTKEADGWELDDFYVLPQYQNQGLGTKVLEHCIAVTDGPIYLYVFVENTGAIRLYERFGFSIVQKVSDTRVIMRRDG